MTESEFSKKVCTRLRDIGAFVVRTQAGSIRGIPDLLICLKGKFFAWELKREDGEPTELQLYTIEQIGKSGGKAWVVRPSNLEISLNQIQLLAE